MLNFKLLVVDAILERLLRTSNMVVPAETQETMKMSISLNLEKGWTVHEIVSHMRYMEELQPDLDEDAALARMKIVSDRVNARLSQGGNVNE